MSALNDLLRSTATNDTGNNRIPGLWRGTVVSLDGGVWVIIPRLTDQERHGPMQHVGALPAVGDQVLVGSIEGRVDDFIVLGQLTW